MINIQKLLQDVTLGSNLKRLRKAQGISQYDMVRELQLRGRSMTRSGYAHIEQGIRNLYISDLLLIREILNVSMDEIFQGIIPITKN